jgi:hypothetical protein
MCPVSASCVHIGTEKKTAPESIHRACKGLVDLVRSRGGDMGACRCYASIIPTYF